MTRWLQTVWVLWWRDMLRFVHQPSRMVGALGQPLLFWGIIGSGFNHTFHLSGVAAQNLSYSVYFFPGVITMIALFSSIFASVSLFEDKTTGFLRMVLVTPAPRAAVVLGKCLGSTTVALLQVGLFLLLLPLAGFALPSVYWPSLMLALFLLTFMLSCSGFWLAMRLETVQAYHALQMLLLVPLWVVSGALFPVVANRWMQVLQYVNPFAYALSVIRLCLHGSHAADLGSLIPFGLSLGLGVLLLVALLQFCLATSSTQPRAIG